MEKTSSIFLLALLAAPLAPAGVIYDNSANDIGQSFFWSSGWDELGDQITLGGTDRSVTSAQLQLFNLGAAGTFDATLRFYNVGSPVGSGLGEFTLTTLAAPDFSTTGGVFNLTFSTGGVTLPDDVIFTLAVFNQSSGVDLGLNLFDPPVFGSSDSGFAIRRQGTSFSLESGADLNYYLVLDASSGAAVPEPGAVWLVMGGIALGVVRRGKRTQLDLL